jgi:hypothetical protein
MVCPNPSQETRVPGPGRESPFEHYCGAEYERILEIAREMMREHTAIDEELAETLARRIAAAHADSVYKRLSD